MGRRPEEGVPPVGMFAFVAEGRSNAAVDSRAASTLRGLGVTHVTILRSPGHVLLVLEGWSLDARRADRAAGSLFEGTDGLLRFRPIAEISLSPGGVAQAAGWEADGEPGR